MREDPNELYKVTVVEYDCGAQQFGGKMTRSFSSLYEAHAYKVYWEIDDDPYYIWRASIEKVN